MSLRCDGVSLRCDGVSLRCDSVSQGETLTAATKRRVVATDMYNIGPHTRALEQRHTS